MAAIHTVFLDVAWRQCLVRCVRDLLGVIEKGSAEMVAATIRTLREGSQQSRG